MDAMEKYLLMLGNYREYSQKRPDQRHVRFDVVAA